MDIEALRRIAANWQHERVDGVRIDANTASLIVQIYDKLDEKNRARYGAMSVDRAAQVAWKLATR